MQFSGSFVKLGTDNYLNTNWNVSSQKWLITVTGSIATHWKRVGNKKGPGGDEEIDRFESDQSKLFNSLL